jgi:hypothetical protein
MVKTGVAIATIDAVRRASRAVPSAMIVKTNPKAVIACPFASVRTCQPMHG